MADGNLKVYFTSVTSCGKTKKDQLHIMSILESKKIPFEKIDVSADRSILDKMREIVGDEKAKPPQIVRGETLLGDVDRFDVAVEDEELETFLKLK